MTSTLIKPQGMDSTKRLASKIIRSTRDMTAAGVPTDVSYTGVGFQPTAIISIAGIAANKQVSMSLTYSIN